MNFFFNFVREKKNNLVLEFYMSTYFALPRALEMK